MNLTITLNPQKSGSFFLRLCTNVRQPHLKINNNHHSGSPHPFPPLLRYCTDGTEGKKVIIVKHIPDEIHQSKQMIKKPILSYTVGDMHPLPAGFKSGNFQNQLQHVIVAFVLITIQCLIFFRVSQKVSPVIRSLGKVKR